MCLMGNYGVIMLRDRRQTHTHTPHPQLIPHPPITKNNLWSSGFVFPQYRTSLNNYHSCTIIMRSRCSFWCPRSGRKTTTCARSGTCASLFFSWLPVYPDVRLFIHIGCTICRPACHSTLFQTWETLLQEIEADSAASGEVCRTLSRQVNQQTRTRTSFTTVCPSYRAHYIVDK